MPTRFVSLAAAALLLTCLPLSQPLQASPPGPQEEVPQAAMRLLAEALIPSYEGKDESAELATLFQLQLVAGRFREAEATVERLAALRRKTNPAGARRLIPWQIYARAGARSGGLEAALDQAFIQALRELVVPLGDKEAVELLPLFDVNVPAARQQLTAAARACPAASPSCAGALDLALASAFVSAWSVVMRHSGPLLKAEIGRRFIVDDRLLVPVPGGARVAALVIRPRSPERLTSLLNFTIYAKDEWSFSDAAKMAAYGYAGVVAYSRGKGRSPGPAVPYRYDGRDAAAVIDWIASQGWSDGRVGMFSGSYNAFTQWAAAKYMPKALKAIATHASNAPGIDTPMERNVFTNFVYPWPLYTTTAKGLNEVLYFDAARWAALNRNWYLSGRQYRDLEKIDGTPNPIFAEWLKHPSYDAYWQELIPFGKEFAQIKIPVFVQTGYFDGGMVGALYYLREHYKHRPSADHRLLIGPYHHTAMTSGVLNTVSGYEIDQAARVDLQDIRLKWFDHVFRGAPLPALLSDRINFEVMGANKWRHVSSLEAMGTGKMRLYLTNERKGGRLALKARKPTHGSSAALTIDFKDRSDVDYQAPSQIFSRDLDARNALVFASAPFADPVEVNGSFIGKLDILVNKKDLDLSIALYEQLPDGSYFPLTNFIGRASYLGDRSRRRLLQAGRPQTLTFESDRITSRLVRAGSRIVATVGVLKQPDIQINYGTGDDVSDESSADAGEPMSIRIASDSFLELNVWQ